MSSNIHRHLLLDVSLGFLGLAVSKAGLVRAGLRGTLPYIDRAMGGEGAKAMAASRLTVVWSKPTNTGWEQTFASNPHTLEFWSRAVNSVHVHRGHFFSWGGNSTFLWCRTSQACSHRWFYSAAALLQLLTGNSRNLAFRPLAFLSKAVQSCSARAPVEWVDTCQRWLSFEWSCFLERFWTGWFLEIPSSPTL